MEIVAQILNSEGPLLAICREKRKLYIMVKEHNRNEYSYFPLDKKALNSYLEGNITLAGLIPDKDRYSCVNEHYTSLANGLLAESKQAILDKL